MVNDAPRQPPTDVLLLLGRIDGKLDAMQLAQSRIADRQDEVEDRMNALERKFWYGTGFVTALTVAINTLWNVGIRS